MKEIFWDRQFRVWVGVVKGEAGGQIGDCEYFATKPEALVWKSAK